MFKRFIDCYNNEDMPTEYYAGHIVLDDDAYVIASQMRGAEDTFSVGQPVYDKDHNLMGYLGIGLFNHLDWSADIRIPVDKWVVLMPTKHCARGKQVFTYFQNKASQV